MKCGFRASNYGEIKADFGIGRTEMTIFRPGTNKSGIGGTEMTIFRPGTNQNVGLVSIQTQNIKIQTFFSTNIEVPYIYKILKKLSYFISPVMNKPSK